MKQQQLVDALREKHDVFKALIAGLEPDDFVKSADGKWSAARQFDHIIKSVDALLLVFRLPRFVPRLLFGKVSRVSKSYEQVVQQYQEILAKGAKAGKAFIPPSFTYAQKQALIAKYDTVAGKLCAGVSAMSERDLDSIQVPHPLMGKLTLREMLYFTLYHVQHHHMMVDANLREWKATTPDYVQSASGL